MYVGIEIGGTKILMTAGRDPSDLSAPVRFPTRDPAVNSAEMIAQLHRFAADHGELGGIGIASFGPIGVSPGRPDYGIMLPTPKPGWSHFDLLGPLQAEFPDVPISLDTDVNGAALGELHWGNARGLDNFAYVTIGTGIGVGLIVGGRPVHGLLHPEAGHVRVLRDPARDSLVSQCPFHDDCLEGLASGPTVLARSGQRGEDLPIDHPVWSLIGDYLAQLYYTLVLTASPQRIIVGGSVGLNRTVMSASRDRLHALLGGYIGALSDRPALDSYLAPAGLHDRAGVAGALALARAM